MKSGNGKKYIPSTISQSGARASVPSTTAFTKTHSMNKAISRKATNPLAKAQNSRGAAASSFFLNSSGSTYSLNSRPGNFAGRRNDNSVSNIMGSS